MKVSELMAHLSKMNPDDEVCALVYDKEQFDFPEDEELTLTTEGWQRVCKEFDEMTFNNLYESLHMAVLDYAEMSPIANI